MMNTFTIDFDKRDSGIPVSFTSREAAQWYLDNTMDSGDSFTARYTIRALPLFDLETAKRVWPKV